MKWEFIIGTVIQLAVLMGTFWWWATKLSTQIMVRFTAIELKLGFHTQQIAKLEEMTNELSKQVTSVETLFSKFMENVRLRVSR